MKRPQKIIYIRTIDNNQIRPLLPSSWFVVSEDDGWFTIYPFGINNTVDFVHLKHLVSHPTFARAIYTIFGTQDAINAFDEMMASDGLNWTRSWDNIDGLRNDNNQSIQSLRSVWQAQNGQSQLTLTSRMAGYAKDNGEPTEDIENNQPATIIVADQNSTRQ